MPHLRQLFASQLRDLVNDKVYIGSAGDAAPTRQQGRLYGFGVP